jgi:hypothetical protein
MCTVQLESIVFVRELVVPYEVQKKLALFFSVKFCYWTELNGETHFFQQLYSLN